eukprot:contig_18363_g4504
MCDIPAVSGPSACGWAVPLSSIGVPDVVPALKTALAPAVGKGLLTSLGQSSRASSRFPLLSDLHVDANGGSLAPAGRTLRQHVALAASHMLVIDLPALKRLHVGLRVEGVAIVLRSLSSATLEVLSLSTSPLYMPPVLPTSALACLPSRCPALRAMCLQDMRLDRSFPGTLALWGLHGNYVKCHLVSPFHATDEAAVTSTQFL